MLKKLWGLRGTFRNNCSTSDGKNKTILNHNWCNDEEGLSKMIAPLGKLKLLKTICA
jgi:hypothetical protein